MPMLIVNDHDFDAELENCRSRVPTRNDNKPTAIVETDPDKGRGHTKEVPENLRKLIGAAALEDNNRALSEAFGISKSSVSAYKNGATSTSSYNKPDKALVEHVGNKRAQILDESNDKILLALKELTGDKLAESNAKILSAVARDLSTVNKNLAETSNLGGDRAPIFIIHAPQQRKEEHYEVIDVSKE